MFILISQLGGGQSTNCLDSNLWNTSDSSPHSTSSLTYNNSQTNPQLNNLNKESTQNNGFFSQSFLRFYRCSLFSLASNFYHSFRFSALFRFSFYPKFYLILGILFNLCLLGFFKYTDFFLENFHLFTQLVHLDFDIPLPHILLPLALSFVTFQQIAFLVDCYKHSSLVQSLNEYTSSTHKATPLPHFAQDTRILDSKQSSLEYQESKGDSQFGENLESNSIKSKTMTESNPLDSHSHKHSLTHINFLDYCLFITFFPQLIAGPIVHHREMMPQFARLSRNSSLGNHSTDLQDLGAVITKRANPRWQSDSDQAPSVDSQKSAKKTSQAHLQSKFATQQCNSKAFLKKLRFDKKCGLQEKDKEIYLEGNDPQCLSSLSHLSQETELQKTHLCDYESVAKGLFIFSIGLFKKVFIADSFAKWANAGFGVVENGGMLNLFESWVTSLSYTFQLYFDFSGYCDMAIGLGLLFGIMLPINFNSPYKALNIADFWRRWHMTLGRFLKEYVYIPLGGNKINKLFTLRNLFIVAFLSGIWHGAGWGFVIWGGLHGVAMCVHRVYMWWYRGLEQSLKNGSLGMQCDKIVDFCKGTDTKSANLPKNPQSLHSHTANTNFIVCNSELRESTLSKEANSESKADLVLDLNTESSFTQSNQDSQKQSLDSKAFTESNPIDSKTITQSTQPDNRPHSFARFYTSFRHTRFYALLCWLLTFNFVNITWIFFRSENIQGAFNLIKGMFGGVVVLPSFLESKLGFLGSYYINGVAVGFGKWFNSTSDSLLTMPSILCALVICLMFKNSIEFLRAFSPRLHTLAFGALLFYTALFMFGIHTTTEFLYFNF